MGGLVMGGCSDGRCGDGYLVIGGCSDGREGRE